MSKKLLILASLGLILSGLPLFTGRVLAYRGDPSVQGPNCSPERHEAMTQAFESGDYNAWKELMNGKGRVTQIINEQNFARFSEAHKLALKGEIAEAKKIREELGLGLHNGSEQLMNGGYGKNAAR